LRANYDFWGRRISRAANYRNALCPTSGRAFSMRAGRARSDVISGLQGSGPPLTPLPVGGFRPRACELFGPAQCLIAYPSPSIQHHHVPWGELTVKCLLSFDPVRAAGGPLEAHPGQKGDAAFQAQRALGSGGMAPLGYEHKGSKTNHSQRRRGPSPSGECAPIIPPATLRLGQHQNWLMAELRKEAASVHQGAQPQIRRNERGAGSRLPRGPLAQAAAQSLHHWRKWPSRAISFQGEPIAICGPASYSTPSRAKS